MWRLALVILASCEQAPPSRTTSELEPAPPPIVPVPSPKPPIEHTTIDGPNVIRMEPTGLALNGRRILDITPSTSPAELTSAVETAMKRSTRPHDERVLIEAEATMIYEQIVAVMKGSRNAGYPELVFSALPASP